MATESILVYLPLTRIEAELVRNSLANYRTMLESTFIEVYGDYDRMGTVTDRLLQIRGRIDEALRCYKPPSRRETEDVTPDSSIL